jgi:ribulose 1,5-bisphosphate carboxylase large subunit-like protein
MSHPSSSYDPKIFCARENLKHRPHIYLHCVIEPAEGLKFKDAVAMITTVITLGTMSTLSHDSAPARLLRGGRITQSDPVSNSATIAIPIEMCSEREGLVQLLTLMLLGNEFAYAKSFRVDQIELPDEFVNRFPGPRFGIEGLRKLAGVPKDSRPLLGAVVRPRQGVDLDVIGKRAEDALLGGADLVVDDAITTDPPGDFAFEFRVKTLVKARENAKRNTHENKLCFVNVTSSWKHLLKFANLAKDLGADGLIVNGFAVGFSSIEVLSEETGLPVVSSNIGVGALTLRGSRVVSEQVISLISRLAGADAVHTGGAEVGFISPEVLDSSATALKSDYLHVKPSFPVVEMDIGVKQIAANFEVFGKDFILEACSGIFNHPKGPLKGSRAFRIVLDSLQLAPDGIGKQGVQDMIVKLMNEPELKDAWTPT